MLSVFYGSDRKAVVDAVNAKTSALPGEVVTIDATSYQAGQYEEVTATTSLFAEASVYVVDTPSSQADFMVDSEAALGDMAESANHFFVMEGALLAAAKKKYAKHAAQIEEFSATKADRFNTFTLTDALARKDKKTLWMLLQEAFLLGVKEEEIIGVMWWQLKSMRLAVLTTSAEAAGMKSYPYQKAKAALQKYSPEEVVSKSHQLLMVYHEGHQGVVDLRLALEQFVLKL